MCKTMLGTVRDVGWLIAVLWCDTVSGGFPFVKPVAMLYLEREQTRMTRYYVLSYALGGLPLLWTPLCTGFICSTWSLAKKRKPRRGG